MSKQDSTSKIRTRRQDRKKGRDDQASLAKNDDEKQQVNPGAVLLKQCCKMAVEMNQQIPAGKQELHRGILPRHI